MDIKKRTIDTPIEESDYTEFFKLAEEIGWNHACEYFPNLEIEKPKEEIFTCVNRKIKELREENGLTQTELAKVFGITQKEYWRMEQDGVSLNIMRIASIAMFYNISIDWFTGFYGERKPFYEKNAKTYINGYCLLDMLEAKRENKPYKPKEYWKK